MQQESPPAWKCPPLDQDQDRGTPLSPSARKDNPVNLNLIAEFFWMFEDH